MVGGLLAILVVAVLQLALALHVRTTLLDAAAEGARFAALADQGPAAGAERTRQLIATAIGTAYAGEVSASSTIEQGIGSAVVTVLAPLPVVGLLGVDVGLEVTAHAPLERVSSD